ncbi:MAG: hypothetical protein DBX53_07420 [Clostridiales bacterium]|nr:MAG: hypothetical protein DBX53_07420 [Clostridiales bacterium]
MKLDVWSISIKKDLTVLKFLLGERCESKKGERREEIEIFTVGVRESKKERKGINYRYFLIDFMKKSDIIKACFILGEG